MQNNYQILLSKLDQFINRYYLNEILKGAILYTGSLLLFFLMAIIADYLLEFSDITRAVVFYLFISLATGLFVYWLFIPVLKKIKIIQCISYEDAARMIGNHFPDINDKIINTLQLNNSLAISGQQLELIIAGINQKIKELNPIPFNIAIDFKKNKRFLPYALPPLFILLGLFFASPGWFNKQAERLLNYNKPIGLYSPFTFEILNDSLSVVQQSDFVLQVKVNGSQLPEEVYIETEQGSFRLNKETKTKFNYRFKNVNTNQSFRIFSGKYYSPGYVLKVLLKPRIVDFDIKLEFPKYTGLINTTVSNTGDLSVPEGTRITWLIKTNHASLVKARFTDTLVYIKPGAKDFFQFSTIAVKQGTYSLVLANNKVKQSDSASYYINVIPDTYPQIEVNEKTDTTQKLYRYFTGDIKDDYGFTRLAFHYRFLKTADSLKNNQAVSTELPLNKTSTSDQFIYFWDMTKLNIAPGEEIEYYFTVYDNDGFRGPKMSRSVVKVFKAPTLDQISESTEKNNREIKQSMENALREASKLKRDWEQARQDMLEKKSLKWQDKLKLENLMEKQQSLQKQIEDIKQKNEQNNKDKTAFKELDPELLEKQKQLEELMDKLLTEDLKKMFEELRKLMEQLDKNKIQEKLEKIDQSNKDLNKELDRALELFKKFELEQKTQELIDKLDKLSQEQHKLSEETKQKNANLNEILQKQEAINKEFEKFKEDWKDVQDKNEELQNKLDLPQIDREQESITNDINQSKQELGENKPKKASESQKNASDKMKQMKEQMEQAMQSAQMQEMQENIEDLRQLLENLIKLSFEQETNMKELAKTNTKDPKYVKLGQKQKKLHEDFKMVEDSLNALAKRIPDPSLFSYITQEVNSVNKNMQEALSHIAERRTGQANAAQQYAMTSLNNLALILDQALENFMQQLAQAKSSGQCNKPGNGQGNKPGQAGKPGMGLKPSDGAESIKKMQEQLGKKLEQLKKQLEQGNKPGGNKPANSGLPGIGGDSNLSKELAEMAAKQEELRRKLQQLSMELNKDGSGNGNNLKKIAEQMEKNEEDIVNKNITLETIKRQQDILTRLLESEKALREREFDEERKSNEAKNTENSNSFQFLEYKRKKEKELELLRTIPPALTPYYKNRVNEYFNILK
jgi:hypothetical protein